MINLAQARAGNARSRRPRWILVSLLGAVVVIAAAAITSVAVSLHYLHAPGLTTDGGGWLPPDQAHARFIRVGEDTATAVPPRPGHSQTFEMEIYNPSSVTQTVLGLTDAADLGNPESTAEPEHLTISTRSSYPHEDGVRFSSGPVAIAPHKVFRLRLTHDTGHSWEHCRTTYWNEISLQVRVGAFTRTEKLDFVGLIMEIRQSGRGC